VSDQIYSVIRQSGADRFRNHWGCIQLLRAPFVQHHAIGVVLNFQNVGVVATTPTYTKVPPMVCGSLLCECNVAGIVNRIETVSVVFV